MAFIMLATLLLSLSLMKSRLPPRKSGPIVDFSAFQDPAYSIFLICKCFGDLSHPYSKKPN